MSFGKCGATDAAPHTVIHAPTRGATLFSAPVTLYTPTFQSTPLREGRPTHLVRML